MRARWCLVLSGLLASPAAGSDTPCASRPPDRAELFGEGLFSTGFDDAHVTFTPDGRTAYFLRDTPDFAHWTVLATRCQAGVWQPPEVASFSGQYDDGDVYLSPDEARLLFVSKRPVEGHARQDTEIWEIRRTPQGWAEPRHVAELSSPGDEWFPTMTRDGWLYFGSDRAGGLGMTDIWRSRWDGQRFLPPENLGAPVNSAGQEIEPYVDPDGRFLLVAAKGRSGGAGDYDVFVSFSCDGGWTMPRPLGAGVNSPGWDFGARITPDGGQLFFTSNRSTFPRDGTRLDAATLDARLRSPGNGLRDIYHVAVSALDLRSPCDVESKTQR